MRRILLCLLIAVVSVITASAQRKTDPLDRGLVAVKTNSGVFVSWRVQADEYYGVTYNLYRNGSLIAQNLLASNYSDTGGNTSSTYTVAPVKNGVVGAQCAASATWAKQYLEIPMANVQASNGVTIWKHSSGKVIDQGDYAINDVALGDVDGDGKIDFIVKRKNMWDANSLFPTNNGLYFAHIECYASSINYGRLWWIDCGPNICYGADEQWDAVAFDWNEDGACEVLYRGGANTVLHHSDGTTRVIGNASENIRGGISHSANATFTNAGEEWLMYIDGRTGKAYDVISYPLPRGKASDWGDGYGHRSSKYFMGAPYLDGINPYIFLGRGIYTKIDACTYRVNKSTNKLYKVGSTWHSYNNAGWYGQGNHNFSIADVDLDGSDEIIYGSMVLDFHTGDTSLHGMSSTGLGHGDASHTGDLDPYRKGLETFACNEERPGNNFRNAATCEIYARTTAGGDDGRAMAGNFTNDYPGGQGASTSSGIIPLSYVQPNPTAPTYINGLANNWNANTPNPIALNFRIYWDGDLLSETINGPGASEGYLFVDKWGGRIFDTGHGNYETTNINGTKKNPCATGDILGDWREEIVMRSSDNRFLRVYTTVTPTTNRMPSLWYDHQYRQAMVWQTEGYNQPPHPSFFVGELEGLTQAPPPLTWTGRSADYNGELRGSLIGGKDVLIMTYGEGQERSIKVNANACPSTLFINSRTTIEGGDQVAYKETKHTWDRVRFTGEPFTGTTNICKQGASATHFSYGNHTHSGKTDVWDGALICNGSVLYSPIWANIHTELFLGNSLDAQESEYKSIEMEYGSALYITSQAISTPLITDNGYAHMKVGNLSIKEGSRIVFDFNGANNANGDKLDITGIIDIRKRNWQYGPRYSAPVFEIHSNGALAAGDYLLGDFGTLGSGSLGDIVVETPNGKSGSVAQVFANGGKYYLHIGNSKVSDNSGDPLNIGGKIFYVYNELQDKFLSRNGNNAQVDNFGVPMVFQSSGSTYSLMQADNSRYYSGMYWTEANSTAENATKYLLAPVSGMENTFTFHNNTNAADDGNMYINTKELYRVANNSSAVNTPDLRNSYWKLVTVAERNAIIANRTEQAAVQAAELAGITVENYSNLSQLTVEENCTNAIPNTTFGLAAENNVYEVFQGTVNLTQTATGLKKGLYRVTLPALYRQGTYADCATLADNRMSIAYMEVDGKQVQIKDWASAYTNTSNPNSRAEANVKFNEGKYVNEAYAYVANDNGTLTIKLGCPINITAGWFAFGAIKLERLSSTVTTVTVYDFASWDADKSVISNNDNGQYKKVGTAWEIGNARYQDIYKCVSPTVMGNEFAFQAVTNEWNGKGTIIREGYGMGMLNATRSAAVLNLNAGAVVTFNIANTDKFPIDFKGGGEGDGTWNVEKINGGYRVTMLTDGNLGFCMTKGTYNDASSYITKITVQNPQKEASGETPEEPEPEPEEPAFRLEDGEYFVYNVEADSYLSNGAHWGTQAVLGSEGILYKISYNESTKKYTLKSGIKGADKALRPSDGFNDQSGEWEILDTDDGLVLFNGTKYYSHNGDSFIPQFLDEPTFGSIWKFVTPQARKEQLINASISAPVDATVYIKAPDFLNEDIANAAWEGGVQIGGDRGQNCELTNSTNGEVWNKGTYTVSQTITDIPNGVYTLTMQGFYRQGDATDPAAASAFEAGTEILPSLFANDKKVAMKSVFSEAKNTAEGGWATNSSAYFIPNSQAEAAACFSTGAYVNTIENIVVTDNTLTIGVTRNGEAVKEWTIFDTFRLTYFGEKEEEIAEEVTPLEPTKIFTSIEEIGSNVFAIVNLNDNKALYGSDAQNMAYDTAEKAFAEEAATNYYKLEKTDGGYLLQTIKYDRESNYYLWGNPVCYLNAQPAEDGVTFNLGLNEQNGQDMQNGAVWNLQYVEGKGFTLQNVGNTAYLAGTKTSAEPSYWTLCTFWEPLKEEEQPVEPEPFEPVIANGDYYIMNAESGLFLNGANAWGTKASATTYGQLLTLKMNEDGTYTIDTHISNGGDNHYLGIGDNTFMDQPAANHTIEMVSDGIFTIKNDGKLLAVNEGNIVNFNGTEANNASLWKIVSKSEVLAANASAASAETPVDMTFLIADPNFSRNNTEFNKWEGNKPNKGDGKNATYAQNMNAEMWGGNSQLFDSYQTLTGLPNGIYKLSAQGFYRYNNTTENTNDVAAAAHAAGTEKINSFLYANDAQTPLMSIADEEAVAANGGKMPFSQLEAKNAFELGLYNNEVEVEVTDGTLRIGVKKTLHEGTDWTIWDNMKLTYLGEKPEEPLFAKGDVNHDGSVNIADVNALVSIILGKSTDTYNAADINDDKSIDISDVTSLIILVSVK
ncbi:MAG: hypothetical protein MJZ41_08630 [Bacteroidaceae bacterium]|nr:hypothetical protein [Bacteroidaceae bacterium]